MVNSLSILGSTGSIGTQTLDVADKLNLKVSALTASTNIKLLEERVRKYKRYKHPCFKRYGRTY